MPSYPALEVPDVLKVQSLFVLPSRATAQRSNRLAPIEMAAPSIHLAQVIPC